MKTWLIAALVAGLTVGLAPEADAKRLGGARSSGMQRSTPDKPVQNSQATPATPANAATPAAVPAGATAAAAAPKRNWMGPIAGLAAGLGLAALFSHLGMGAGLANFVMMALLAVVAFVAIRFLMRRFGPNAQRSPLAMAGAGAGTGGRNGASPAAAAPPRFVDERPGMQRDALAPTIGSDLRAPLAVDGWAPAAAGATAVAPVAHTLPAGFDREAFERLAKMIFIRMQAANDSADLNDLRNFTTPELFASLRLDLQDRGDAKQATDVQKVDAQVLDFADEGEQQIVSVRFTGLVKEAEGTAPEGFDEIWHLVKPKDDSRNWSIAGIQQAK